MARSQINIRCKQLTISCLFTPSCCSKDHCQMFLSWTKFFRTSFINTFCKQYPGKFRKQDTVLTDSFWEVILTSCIIIKEEKLFNLSGNHLIALSSCLPLLGCVPHTPFRKRPSFPFSTRFLWKFASLRIGEALNFTKIVRACSCHVMDRSLKSFAAHSAYLIFTIPHSRKIFLRTGHS